MQSQFFVVKLCDR